MLAKVAFYQQTNTAAADLSDVCAPARFYASAQPMVPGTIGSSKVRLPNRTMRGLVEPIQTFLEYNEDFPSRTTMDKVFRSGAYTVTVNTRSDELKVYTLRMTREPRFAVPHLSNWDEAQQIDATAPFALTWDVFEGAGPDDQVAIGIRDSKGDVVIQLPEVFAAGTLDAATTSYTIPADLLRPGERYHVNLTFRKVTQLKTMESGTLSCTVFAHSTGTWIETRPLAGASVFQQSAAECCGVAGLALPE
jgi:hypothetical protein